MNQPTIVWATFCVVAVGVALMWPRFARYAFGGFFILMALGVNVMYAILAPAGFVGLGADDPLVPAYAWVFENVVALAPVAFGLAVATYEVAVGILMIRGGRAGEWGLLGGIVFLLASSPLSTWTLPNLIFAVALAIILVRSRTVGTVGAGGSRPVDATVPDEATGPSASHPGA
jgi:hypothetical protein